ncbi:hypothetical protein [Paenibacillus sp. Z6-24]
MAGNIKLNLWFGIIGFVITFLVSFGNNLWTTSLFRGILGFVVWFLLAFVLRFILGILANPAGAVPKMPPGDEESIQQELSQDDQDRGSRFDVVTPDQDNELHDLLTPKPANSGQKDEFAPLNPPKLVSTKQQDPEELAKAVRHLTQK